MRVVSLKTKSAGACTLVLVCVCVCVWERERERERVRERENSLKWLKEIRVSKNGLKQMKRDLTQSLSHSHSPTHTHTRFLIYSLSLSSLRQPCKYWLRNRTQSSQDFFFLSLILISFFCFISTSLSMAWASFETSVKSAFPWPVLNILLSN